MSWLGCRDALNLDGGGSSTMVFDGNIVNHPSDNKKFDHQGERVVANAIVVRSQ
jgi:exopolysaccharide biosynthesis protein